MDSQLAAVLLWSANVDALANTQAVSAVSENDLRVAANSLDVFAGQTKTEPKSKLTGVA